MRAAILAIGFLTATATTSAQERVDIATTKGVKFAVEFTNAGNNTPVALFFPMCWATPPETWAPVAAALRPLGVSSVVATYPGAPGNPGWPGPQPPPNPSVYWDEQFREVREAAFTFANSHTNRPLVIAGASCGVERALGVAADHADRVAAVVVFAGAHSAEQLAYVKSRHVPVLGLTSRGENEWVIQHDVLVKASGDPASRMIVRDEDGHGTVLLKDRAFASEIAAWISARLHVSSAPASAPKNFSGTWLLDKSASAGLDPQSLQAESIVWTIVQDDKTIAITDKITGGGHAGEGNLGTFNMDGREVSTKAGGSASTTVTESTEWSGSTLALIRKQAPDGRPGSVGTRSLSLSDDGKTLTVLFHYTSARAPFDQTLVFKKQHP